MLKREVREGRAVLINAESSKVTLREVIYCRSYFHRCGSGTLPPPPRPTKSTLGPTKNHKTILSLHVPKKDEGIFGYVRAGVSASGCSLNEIYIYEIKRIIPS